MQATETKDFIETEQADWKEVRRNERIAIASKKDLELDDLLEILSNCEHEVKESYRRLFSRFTHLNMLLVFLDDFDKLRLTDEEKKRFDEFYDYFVEISNDLYAKFHFWRE
jgi:hypothetical protein